MQERGYSGTIRTTEAYNDRIDSRQISKRYFYIVYIIQFINWGKEYCGMLTFFFFRRDV